MTSTPVPTLVPTPAPAPDATRGPATPPTPALARANGQRPPGRLRRRLQLVGSESGMTTAEYAVGTVAACGFGGVLYKVITNDRVLNALGDLIAKALTLTF